MLMVGVLVAVLAFSLGAVCVAGYLLAAHRARTAADLAALSGAAAMSVGGNSCAAARRNARSNDARVTSCSEVGDQIDFVVTVRAEVDVGLSVPGLPEHMQAVAYAGPDSS